MFEKDWKTLKSWDFLMALYVPPLIHRVQFFIFLFKLIFNFCKKGIYGVIKVILCNISGGKRDKIKCCSGGCRDGLCACG